MKKIIEWYLDSHRYVHLGGGVIILLAMMSYGLPANIPFLHLLVLITIATFLAAIYGEIKDKQHGGRVDWGDVFAEMSPVLLAWAVYLIVLLSRLM